MKLTYLVSVLSLLRAANAWSGIHFSIRGPRGLTGETSREARAECFDGVCDINDVKAKEELEAAEEETRPTVWSEFGALATETNGINLGQGFPNWDPPSFVVEAGVTALRAGFSQYTRTPGHPRLVELLAKRYSKHFNREVKPYSQVAITIGASQALYIAMQVLINRERGDEVILLEPYFDLYVGQIKMAGGVVKAVPLVPRDGSWDFDVDLLRAAMTPRTRLLVLNTPHNPTGKVFTYEELESIAQVCRENPDILVISDEVYKYMIHEDVGEKDETPQAGGGGAEGLETGVNCDLQGVNGKKLERRIKPEVDGAPEPEVVPAATSSGHMPVLAPSRHVHFANLEGMWDRTVTISSAGKTFGVTGWQVGWLLGPEALISQMQRVLPYMQFCAPTPLQEAMATVLETAEMPYENYANYYDWLRHQYSDKKQRLASALSAVGIKPMRADGGFFLVGDIEELDVPKKYLHGKSSSTLAMPYMTRDWACCRWLALEHGIIAIPTSPFFSLANRYSLLHIRYVRFCFCKTDATIEAAAEALAHLPRRVS
ncbi:unnamed protein product [Chrysoparadoxa australica]